jgi:hypothetical protein
MVRCPDQAGADVFAHHRVHPRWVAVTQSDKLLLSKLLPLRLLVFRSGGLVASGIAIKRSDSAPCFPV